MADIEQRIWDAYRADQLDAPSQALIRELGRCAAVLDRLNGLAAGRQEAWATLVFDDMGEIHLTIDKILDEQRKTQVVLKALHAEIRGAGIKPAERSGGKATDEEPEDMLALLRKRKEDRESQSG